MELSFDVISAEEYERQRSGYEPVSDVLRRLIDLAIHTEVDPTTLQQAVGHLEAAAELLGRQVQPHRVALRHADTGRPVTWGNPAVGVRNAIAPPVHIEFDADGSCWSEFTLGPAYEGPPGWVHGGVCALVLDQLLGEVASEGLTKPKFTGTISLRYLRGTPLGPLRAEGFIERSEGIKTIARGVLRDAEGVTVEAEGVFIKPAWARDAG